MNKKPIQTTEWEDAQYKIGNKVGAYATKEDEIIQQRIDRVIQDTITEYATKDEEGIHANKTLEEIQDAIEDEEDDDGFLEQIRQRRLAQLKGEAEKKAFGGTIAHITKSDYVREVTDGSKKNPVVLLLEKNGDTACEKLAVAMTACAQRHRQVKFLRGQSGECMPGFPDKQLPCVVIYMDGTMKFQVTGLKPWGGDKLTPEDVEFELTRRKVLKRPDGSDNDEGDDEEGSPRPARTFTLGQSLGL